jgi:hypothetical protein
MEWIGEDAIQEFRRRRIRQAIAQAIALGAFGFLIAVRIMDLSQLFIFADVLG